MGRRPNKHRVLLAQRAGTLQRLHDLQQRTDVSENARRKLRAEATDRLAELDKQILKLDIAGYS